jgi:hypothetical protein
MTAGGIGCILNILNLVTTSTASATTTTTAGGKTTIFISKK